MGRAPCCSKDLSLNRRAWTAEEDSILNKYISNHGVGGWKYLPQRAGLKRCWKGCRLRWFNYLRPDIKRGNISADEEDLIIRMHNLLGNRWSLIAGRLPGRTDNEIKNYWNTRLLKKVESKEYSPPTAKEICRTSKPQYECSKDHQVLRTTAVRLPKDPYKAFVDELITGSDFEIVEYSSAQNTMQWENPRVEIMGQPSPTCLMDNQFSVCPNNREDEVNTCNSSLYLNEMCPAEDNFPWSPYNFITEEWIDELQYL